MHFGLNCSADNMILNHIDYQYATTYTRDAQYRPTNGPYKDLQSGGYFSMPIVHGGINLLTYHDNPNVTFSGTAT